MVAVCSEPELTGVLDARMPGDEVLVAYRDGDWVRLHSDEGFGDDPAWMLVDGTARGLGIMLEFQESIACPKSCCICIIVTFLEYWDLWDPCTQKRHTTDSRHHAAP